MGFLLIQNFILLKGEYEKSQVHTCTDIKAKNILGICTLQLLLGQSDGFSVDPKLYFIN